MKIQLSEIRPHPDNPRSFLEQDIVDAVAKSMDKDGLLNSVKLVLLTDERKAGDGLVGQGTNYYILCGHYRYAAAKKLGWTEIEAVVVKGISRADEMLELIMGNKAQPPNWFDDYLGIEKYMALCPDLNNQEIADKLQLRFQYVGDVAKVMRLLNTAARAQICGQLRNPELSTIWKIPESAVIALTGLASGYPDDLDKMEKSLKVLIKHKMTEKQAKKLALWVKAGNSPEEFPVSGKGVGVSGEPKEQGQDWPYEGLLRELKNTGYFQIKMPAKGGIHIIIIQGDDKAALGALGAAGALWWSEHKDSKLEDNPYWADVLGLIKKIKAGDVEQENKFKGQGSKAQEIQGNGQENKSLVSSFKFLGKDQGKDLNPKLETTNQKLETSNPGFELAKDLITQAENHVPQSLPGKIGHAVFKQGVKMVKNWMKKR